MLRHHFSRQQTASLAAASLSSPLPTPSPGFRTVIDNLHGKCLGGTNTRCRIIAVDVTANSVLQSDTMLIGAAGAEVSATTPYLHHPFNEGEIVTMTVQSDGTATTVQITADYHFEKIANGFAF